MAQEQEISQEQLGAVLGELGDVFLDGEFVASCYGRDVDARQAIRQAIASGVVDRLGDVPHPGDRTKRVYRFRKRPPPPESGYYVARATGGPVEVLGMQIPVRPVVCELLSDDVVKLSSRDVPVELEPLDTLTLSEDETAELEKLLGASGGKVFLDSIMARLSPEPAAAPEPDAEDPDLAAIDDLAGGGEAEAGPGLIARVDPGIIDAAISEAEEDPSDD